MCRAVHNIKDEREAGEIEACVVVGNEVSLGVGSLKGLRRPAEDRVQPAGVGEPPPR